MKHKYLSAFYILSSAIATSISAQTALIKSGFLSSLEGWTSTAPVNISWSPSGGNPGGYLKFDDRTSMDPWIIAPTEFLDLLKTMPDDSWLSFDYTRIAVGTGFPVDLNIVASSAIGTATWSIPTPNGLIDWQTIEAPLQESEWLVAGTTFSEVFENLLEFKIQIETWANSTGGEINGIDNIAVMVIPETASVIWFTPCAILLARFLRRRR